MMTDLKETIKSVRGPAMVCTLVFLAVILTSPIHIREANAEKKKITGTSKGITRLARSQIPIPKTPVKGWLSVHHLVLNSSDPDWDKATFFNIIYPVSTGEWNHKGFGVITHPGGDQTFIQFKEKYTAQGSVYLGEIKGFFLRGTGKFEGIKGSWNSSWERDQVREEEWEIEYEIK